MNGLKKRIALKPYLETITNDCSKLSKQELTSVILGLAKDESTSRRVTFLQKLQSLLPEIGSNDTVAEDVETILNDIQSLKESITERIEAIENGDYEQLDDWDWEDYHDYDPDYINDEQMGDLSSLFQDAESLFLNDQIEDSRSLYEALFNLMDKINDYGLTQSKLEMDIREERARYARCVYDTSDEHKRLDEFAAAMSLDVSKQYNEHIIDESYPLLQDVIDAREEEMVDIQSFYGVWKKFLTNKGIKGRPASLLAEAVNHLDGIEGVVKLARTWKNNQPYGYLFWLECLKHENKQNDIVEVSKEALQILKAGDAREKVSNLLIEAGKVSGSKVYVLEGKREKFFSNPCDENLLYLLDEAVKQDTRSEELESVLDFFAKQKGMGDDRESLYLKGLLMAGRLDDAFVIVKQSKSIGWSYGLNIGLVFGAVAFTVAGYPENARTIEDLLAGYAGRSDVNSYQITVNEGNSSISFYGEIIKGIQKIKLSESKLIEYFDWALATGKKRVNHIVSNKHRGAYERAAQVLGVLAEMYAAKGDVEKAAKIIHKYYKEKFNRHIAFRKEVKKVISLSRLLKNIDFSV